VEKKFRGWVSGRTGLIQKKKVLSLKMGKKPEPNSKKGAA
jgi:hypothetical protein